MNIDKSIIDGAIQSMKDTGIPASVSLAQGIVETGWFKTPSGKNNYGGITAKVKGAVFPYKPGIPLEPATLCWTHEQYQGQRVSCQRWFKDFVDMKEFWDAHASLLAKSPRYAAARAKLPDVNAFVDVMGPIYATDPNYAKTLKQVMRGSNLYQYDK